MAVVAQCMGLRISEILGLQWQDIDFDGRCLHVRRTITRLSGVKGRFQGRFEEALMESEQERD